MPVSSNVRRHKHISLRFLWPIQDQHQSPSCVRVDSVSFWSSHLENSTQYRRQIKPPGVTTSARVPTDHPANLSGTHSSHHWRWFYCRRPLDTVLHWGCKQWHGAQLAIPFWLHRSQALVCFFGVRCLYEAGKYRPIPVFNLLSV